MRGKMLRTYIFVHHFIGEEICLEVAHNIFLLQCSNKLSLFMGGKSGFYDMQPAQRYMFP